jgi:hypothetical protein
MISTHAVRKASIRARNVFLPEKASSTFHFQLSIFCVFVPLNWQKGEKIEKWRIKNGDEN